VGTGEPRRLRPGLRAALIPMIGYIRVSKGREEMISPDIQRRSIKRWAEANGRVIVVWLEDLDNTGREFAKRKIRNGIARIEAGEAVEIGVYRYDRWGRNAADSLANCKRVENVGGQVRSVTEPFDVETAVGKMSRSQAFVYAEYQSDVISENWLATHADRLDRGMPVTGGPRFGYTCTARSRGGDGIYRPDPVTGPDLAAAYGDYVAGAGWQALCDALNNAGHRTRCGGLWETTALRGVMDSGFAAGLLIHNNGTKPNGPVHYSDATHAPLIDRDLWDAYRRRRKEMAARHPRQAVAVYRLTGLLVCGDCGGGMTRQPDERRGRVWARCSRWARWKTGEANYRDLPEIETAVLEWLRAECDAGHAAQLRREVATRARARRIEADVKALEAEAKELDRAMIKLVDGWSRGIVPQKAYDALYPAKEARAAEIAHALDEATAPLPAPPTAAIADVVTAWESLPTTWANEALRKLIAAVVVTRTQIVVLGRWETL
jgi:site-specific DNA recombinase